MKNLLIALLALVSTSCTKPTVSIDISTENPPIIALDTPSLVVLGTAQDAGSPHIGCTKACCATLFKEGVSRPVVSLGIIDPTHKKKYVFEASPDLPVQLRALNDIEAFSDKDVPDGIFLTHAHIGHYTGLMYLGMEAKGAKEAAVYVMPRMEKFLENNGPWSQLVTQKNISLQRLTDGSEIALTPHLTVQAFSVPHRDEYSETVGYIISGPNKRVLFIPDIDKWERWDQKIEDVIASVDYAFVDATFYDAAEIGHRDISLIPHPFIVESMARFDTLPDAERDKIYFIHLNHTNPALDPESTESALIEQKGYHISRTNSVISL